MHKNVSVILLNYYGYEDTRACLESLADLNYRTINIIVVDNGSRDGEMQKLTREFPRITLIKNKRNLGFAGGNNVGMLHALRQGADYMLLLNNDTTVDRDLITEFIKAAEAHPDAGFFSAKIYYFNEPSRIWFAGARFDERTAQMVHVNHQEVDDGKKFNEVISTDYAIGCALFVRRDVVKKIGLMDERFFLLYEETDWCYTGRRAGYESLMVPHAQVWHKVSASFSSGDSPLYEYYFTRNRFLWSQKNLGVARRLRAYCIMSARVFVPHLWYRKEISIIKRIYWDFLYHKRARRQHTYRARLIALRDFIFRRFGECPPVIYEIQKKYKQEEGRR